MTTCVKNNFREIMYQLQFKQNIILVQMIVPQEEK